MTTQIAKRNDRRTRSVLGVTLAPISALALGIAATPALTGAGKTARVVDTDGGVLDGDTVWDHAVGPMQFLPSTWRAHAHDGNRDGVEDPNNIDDAALAPADYLCQAGGDLGAPEQWIAAITAYNAQIVRAANRFAEAAGAR